MICKTCGAEMIQKSPSRLIATGLVMMAFIIVPLYFPWFWIPAVLLLLVGIYLLTWATLGRAAWCRACKKFSAF